MIVGIGIDIVAQQRIVNSIEEFGDKFLQRVFTAHEISACQRYREAIEHYAGKFAVKEAFMKAIGLGLRQVTFQEIEVLNRESGAPYVMTYSTADEIITQRGITDIHVSISHSADIAVGVVILEKK